MDSRLTQSRSKRYKRRPNIASIIGYPLLLVGSIVLIYSFIYETKIPALIGLGLTFWGAILLFIKTTQYVKKELLDAEIIPLLNTVDNIINELGYKGKGIYVSPRTLRELASTILFIPFDNVLAIPPPEELTTDKVFHEDPKGVCITPPGLHLASIIEDKIGVSLFTIDLDQLQTKLNDVIIRDLEIAQEFNMEIKDQIIHVTIKQHIFDEIYRDIQELKTIFSNIGDPLSSSIACILAKALGRAIIIDRIDLENEKTVEIDYRLLREEPSPPPVTPAINLEFFKRVVRE